MTETVVLKPGSHPAPPDDQPPRNFCVNEGLSWVAGEPWSYTPACVDRLVGELLLRLNDRWDDEQRQLLRPFGLRAIGTAHDGRQSERLRLVREWLVREALPDWMDVAGRTETANRLRALPDDLAGENLLRILEDARDEAKTARAEAHETLRSEIKQRLVERGVPAAAYADAAYAAAYAAAAYAADAAYAAAAYAPSARRRAVYDAVYERVRPMLEARLAPIRERHDRQVLELLDRLLPTEPALTPVQLERARLIGLAA